MNFIQKDRKIVLASASPRRQQLLKQISLDFIVKASSFDEESIYNEIPEQYVMQLASCKAQEVAKLPEFNDYLIIGADTTVYFNNSYLNKPNDEREAKLMLQQLSNNWHQVYSGICLIDNKMQQIETNYSVTQVKFRELNEQEVDYYISTGSPMDKAGSYGIQDDFGALFVEEIKGDYYNVVGLPLVKLYLMLISI
jgi:septum formation protein